MRRALAATMMIAAITFGAGCATSGTAGQDLSGASADRITAAEIEATRGASTAFELVRRLRPRWLQAGTSAATAGGRTTRQVILVYLDGSRIGTVESLRTLSASGIKSMQYYDGVRAATVLRDVGSEVIAGAILISTS